ncbi:MAG: transcriptional repressor [Pegethrix bostrychoides GSE-TBD4-15B]|uniref:Transcriptional repressor n=1 Tax=Pegethrix bostrychoides GSE-TBD4-15B TaxID=2839662 RepID=A0A951PD00_9CYAN|nr:transcriptional repressor [Pegethrix bostrychoides GSE-TBD4-15B]
MVTEAAARKPIQSLEDAIEHCQMLGMRLSKQRRFILELLWQEQDHLSAREIYDRLNQQGKEIGHTSVYQNLEALSAQGVIECVDRADGRLYGNISDPHSHVNCLDTHKIMDVHIELPAELLHQIEQQTGIKVTSYSINFYGHRATEAPEAAL